MIYIYPLLILTLADCLLDSGPHSSIFYVWSILRYVPDHNYIFSLLLYTTEENDMMYIGGGIKYLSKNLSEFPHALLA